MRTIKFILSTGFLLLGLIALLNYFVDPVGIFYGIDSLEFSMAQELAEADNLVITDNYNERNFVKYRIMLEKVEPEVLVAGSSRVMQIGKGTYPEPVFNMGVSYATLRDDVALLFLALKKFHPKKIILGVDPILFDGHANEKRSKSLGRDYNEARAVLLPGQPQNATTLPSDIYFWKRWEQLVSLDYTLASGRKLIRLCQLMYNPAAANDSSSNDAPLPDMDKIRKDGSRVYNLNFQNSSREKLTLLIPIEYFRPVFESSEGNIKLLSSLLDYMQRKATVELFLAPFYPDFYNANKANPVLREVELRTRAIAREKGIRVIGSYNPDAAGCTAGDFYDLVHPRPSCIKKIFLHQASGP